jgi:DNA-binding NarL/FixJ family response regulator
LKSLKRILIADDHVLMLEGLSRLLAGEFEIAGVARDGRRLLAAAERFRPDVIVLDIAMPELNGIEAARRLNKILPSAKLVFVTQYIDPAFMHAAFAAGAMGYVAKQSASTELLRAIHEALCDRYYVTPLAGSEATEFTVLHPKANPMRMFGAALTPRQREVLQLVAEGKSSKEIACALNISVKTVEFHRNSLMDELGVHSIAELTRYAIASGIVT